MYLNRQKFQKKIVFEFGPFLMKLYAKNRNSISFTPEIKKISKLTMMSFLMGRKNVKKLRKSKIKIFQTVRFGVECPICMSIHLNK